MDGLRPPFIPGRASTCLYFAIPEGGPPVKEPLLVLNGEGTDIGKPANSLVGYSLKDQCKPFSTTPECFSQLISELMSQVTSCLTGGFTYSIAHELADSARGSKRLLPYGRSSALSYCAIMHSCLQVGQ